jgi:hypothetical protein
MIFDLRGEPEIDTVTGIHYSMVETEIINGYNLLLPICHKWR